MSTRAVVVLLMFVVSVATSVTAVFLFSTLFEVATWMFIGGVGLFVAACLGLGFLRPMPTDEEVAEAMRKPDRSDHSWLSGIGDFLNAFK